MAQGATNDPDRRLDSWKEIAAFFGRDERTVRRWEKDSALPVHRVPGGAKGRVFAYERELDQWLSTPQALRTTTLALEPPVLEPQASESPASPAQLEVQLEAQEEAPQPEEVPQEVQHADKRWHFGAPAIWLGTLAVCAALVAGIWVYRKSHRFAAYASTPSVSRGSAKNLRPTGALAQDSNFGTDSVAVLPFTNVGGNANLEYLSDGITESLIGNLAHVPQLKVRSRDSVFRYKGKDVDVQTAGRNLRVSVLVSGRVMVQRDAIEISAEVTDVRDNTEIWGRRYQGKRADLISLQRQMAGDIAERLRSSISTADRQQVTNQGTEDAEAYSLYLKGRYAWNNRTYGELQKAISYFNQAIAKDPGYALAYSGLADAYAVLPNFGGNQNEDFPKANAEARKALELDPTLAHPHAVLGSNEIQYEWDFAGGEAEFKKSFELDPNDATAHQWYGDEIGQIGGREQEAFAEIDLAHELDPLSPTITRVVGGVRGSARKFDEEIAICGKLATDNPTFAIAHDCLARGYRGKHMYPQVIEEWKTFGRLSGYQINADFAAAAEQGFRSSGWKGALTKAIEFRLAQRKTGYYSAFDIANLYAGLGDKEQAFHWLDIAYQEHDWELIILNTDSAFDPLHSDPRFAALARKVGLPQL